MPRGARHARIPARCHFRPPLPDGGCAELAYPSIVGGGNNGCVLHYVENSKPLNDGDLVLVDAGCEIECYASDITRTYPVNGRFSEPQRILYELVLEAQVAAIDKARVGNHWNDPRGRGACVDQGCSKLGLIRHPGQSPESKILQPLYMHRTGHWLGMDVHDVGDYKVDGHWRLLERGMVLTVEPGLYIPMGAKASPRNGRVSGFASRTTCWLRTVSPKC